MTRHFTRISSTFLLSSLTALLLLMQISSCSKPDTVQITGFSPDGEVDAFTTFQVDFSEDLAPDDQVGEWSDEAYIQFEPPVEGKYKWISRSSLIFSPSRPLKPGQDYSAKVTDKVLFGSDKAAEFETHSFHTPYFDAVKADIFWTQIPRSGFKVSVQANLFFNYEVDPGQLRKYLTVEKDGQTITQYDIVSQDPGKVIALDFGEQQQTEKEQEFVIRVKKGLSSTETSREMTDSRSFNVALAPLTELAVTSVASGFDGVKGWIEVFTTQKVDEEKLAQYVKVEPRRKLRFLPGQHSFRIEAAFEPGSMVDLSIREGLPGLYGGQLQHGYEQTLVMADLAPKLNFADKTGAYLMRGGEENIEVTSVNVRRVDYRIYEVYENNLLHYLNQSRGGYYSDFCCGVNNYFTSSEDMGRGYDDEYYDDYYYDDYYYYGGANVNNFGKLIHADSVVLNDQKNLVQNFTISLSEHLDQRFKGIYIVEIRDDRDYWRQDVKAISVSDLGIIAKRSTSELTVFVNGIQSAEPVSGATVSLVSTNNQSLVTGTTDSRGMVKFTDLQKDIEGFTPRMVTVRKGEDFNYIDFKETEVGLSRFEVGGKPEFNDTYDTYLYADRNLFRPGETAHFNAIVRTRDLETVTELPLRFKVTSPRGKTFYDGKAELSKEGSAELELPLPNFAETGDYTLEALTGNDQLLNSYSFSVEEFAPDKIRVEVSADKKEIETGETVKLDIFSEYLFGAPSSEHNYEVDINLRHAWFNSKKYPDYTFQPQAVQNESLENDFREGKLDASGKSQMTWLAPDRITASGIIKARAFVTVFDATGRTVTRSAGFDIFPNDYFLGIKTGTYYVSTEEAVPFRFMAVDSRDQPLRNMDVEVEVIRYEWRTVLKQNSNGDYYYQSEKRPVIEEQKRLKINGSPLSYSYRPEKSGSYEIKLRKPGEERYTSRSFSAYSSHTATASSFQVDREGRIEIETDKENYAPGDRAKILFKTPFSGKMLVTLERDKLLEYHYLDVKNNSAELEIPIRDEHLPNMFVSATLFMPHRLNRPTPFLVAHGYKGVRVEKSSNELPVRIVAPERIKPRQKQRILVKSKPEQDIFVTVAVVDEGILQIKDYKTPDPYGYMYANRKLSVSSYDMYQFLLEEAAELSSSMAGGDESGSANRINPITAKRFKLLSFWSGTRRTNAAGEVTVDLDIPQFNGSARIMAVAWKGQRFGAADQMMAITDDVVVMPAAPRFLSPGDSLVLPVSLMNTTDKSGSIRVSVTTEGPISLTSANGKNVSLAAKDNQNVKFGLKVGESVGVGKIIVETTGMDKVREEIELAVRPTSPLVVEDGAGSIEAGNSQVIRFPKGFLDGTQKSKLSISKFPAVQHAGHLGYLLTYPHGCVEQTTSKLFPQLYFDDLVAAIAPETYRTGNPVYFINEGIRRLQSMQLYDGSLAYWPGGSYHSWWGSAYAAHFLVEAKKADFQVNERVLNNLLGFLAQEAAQKHTYTYRYYPRPGQVTEVIKARKEVIYSLYVLALAGKGDLALLNYYRARPHLLTGDTRYLLAGAYGHMKEWTAFREVLPEAFLAETPVRESGGSFDSEVRATAMMLNVLMDVDPNNKQVPALVRHLSKLGKQIYSTQDRAWVFLALGKAASKNARAKVKIDVLVNGKVLATYDDEDISLDDPRLDGAEVTLRASGKGSVYYFWETRGIKLNEPVREVDDNLRVRRQWYNRQGTAISGTQVEQGDLVVCEIEIGSGLRSVENVVISDLIPAGFEIENPRLGESTSLNWIQNSLYPQYLDVRDDRLLVFTSMGSNESRKYFFMMRAVNAGKFKLAPLGAEAMYDPDFKSYHGSRWVEVVAK